MNIVHVSLAKRRDKDGVHLGGVEKFGMYLKSAIPDLRLISWCDFPDWIKKDGLIGNQKASLLSEWMVSDGVVDRDSIVITDGYWGRGLQGCVGRLISVCHGTFFGRINQHMVYPWGEALHSSEVEAQEEMWFSDIEIVCVSEQSYSEVKLINKYSKPKIIRHGIDLDVFKPVRYDRNILMHAATSARKGADVIRLMAEGWGLDIAPMKEYSGSLENEALRLNQAKVLVAPSRHEGNSYLLIEALACGTPLLVYRTGLAGEMDGRCGVVMDDLSPPAFAMMLETMETMDFHPREWAEENCSFERFKNEWREYLHV